MIGKIELPKITSSNPAGQIQQINSLLFQLEEQLNFNLNDIQKEINDIKSDLGKVKGENDGRL